MKNEQFDVLVSGLNELQEGANFRLVLIENRLVNVEHWVSAENQHLVYDPLRHKPE